jgi:hypothetical protein
MKRFRYALIACVLLSLLVGGVLPGQLSIGAAAPRVPPGLPPGTGGLSAAPWYVVVTLESVTVHNDTDPAGPGEIMIVAGAGSGSLTQTAGFPIALWREANTGDTLPVNLPLAVIPSNQMGDDLFLTAAVVDNDDLPDWFANALPVGFAALGAYLGGKLGAAAGGKYGAAPGAAIGGYAGTEVGQALASWLGRNELIGTMEVRYARAGRWGIPAETGRGSSDVPLAFPCGSYTTRGGDATFRYSICAVPAPPNLASLRLSVRLDRLIVHSNGEGAFRVDLAAEVFARTRVTDGVSAPIVNRFPASGSRKLKDGDTWSLTQTVYDARVTSPMIYVEVDAWDADKPSSGNDHDMLGIATWKFAVPYLAQPRAPGESRSTPVHLRVKGIDGGDVSVHVTFVVTRQ